ncbi:MAG: phage minor head protein [Pseudomonas sp.]|nr:phage minor head protein [Pseudomonas sp.]
MSSGDRTKDLLLLYRNITWQYQLENYTDEALKSIQKALNLGRNELLHQIDMMDFRLPEGREHALLAELNDMTFGIQAKLTGNIQEAAAVAGEASYREYGNILSFDGKLAETVGFDFVSVSPAQLRAMAVNVPVGGKLLQDWVANSFKFHITDEIREEMMAGVFKGESIGKIVDRLVESFDMIERDAITLARTWISDANNHAAKAVYDANSDIIDKEQWCAALEVSLKGYSTCLRCAGMDGRTFKLDEEHIRPPLHLRCRCFMLPVTKSWRELGLDIDELGASLRPYTERQAGTSIDKGLTRDIEAAGQFNGDFEKFLDSRGVKYQKDLLGPNRYQLLQDGKIKWDDLVDKNGNVRLLKKDKDGQYVGLM